MHEDTPLNQLLRSEHCLSIDQGRLSIGEDHLSTDGSYLSTATGGFTLSGFWKQDTYRQLDSAYQQ
ncbi:hypothetical protein Taro_023178, partial [Colocasia esculenta]|nr:hypothetical protein [Colocasia esculenta]